MTKTVKYWICKEVQTDNGGYFEPEKPLIMCKDCKSYKIAELKQDGTEDKRYKPSVCCKGAYAVPRPEYWYCADAERKEE